MLDILLAALALPEPQRSHVLDQIGWDCMPDEDEESEEVWV